MIEGKDGAEMECLFYRLNPEHKKAIIVEAEALVVRQDAQSHITDNARDEIETKVKRHCNSATAVSLGAELQKRGNNAARAMR
jgi:hypothetical protein